MKLKTKAIAFIVLALLAIPFITGCSGEKTPYETNNEESYNVSVKYDANGGTFTTNTSVIVDSFNISDIKKNSEGKAEIALLSPDNSKRGNDAFKANKSGYFLAGWYSERVENTDADGNVYYTYSGKWDFDKDLLEVDSNKEYSAEKPVMTLYAAWVPLFEIEFYSLDSGEYMDSLIFDPTTVGDISVPEWDKETGAIEMYNFPERAGYTFNKAYFDAKGEQSIDTATITHNGVVNYENGTAENSVMKLYVDWTEGEWYHIYNVEQFIENASLNGHYELHADLDFADEIWPTVFMYGNFNGEIKGNGHTIKNVELTQTNNSKVNAGLFGYLTETAEISDLTFENISFTIKKGTRVAGTCYGLFAGTISNKATINNVQILNSVLKIDSSCYFAADDYSIGLVCGMGDATVVNKAEIECVVVAENPENMYVTVNGNTVTIDFAD